MKRVSGGALISLPVGLFLASKSSTGPPFSSPLRSLIVNSTRTNFSPHWKKCSFSCRSVFGLKQHWPLESIGTRFSAPVVLFLPKSNTGKRCFCGCVFLAQGVKLRRFQVERARNLQDDFFLKNCW